MAKRVKDLNRLTDDELLDLRFCDLAIKISGTTLEARVEQLYDELAARQIKFRPHCWLAEEWFSPDGVPGIAIPFYLAHPRLVRLERKQMLDVEGGTRDSCMRILRHEAGHAVDTAYRLRRRRRYRDVFGMVSQPYPSFYRPKPYSKRFVLHLGMWYAQAHPVEDFAETFAVWLRPRSRWRSQYKAWPALKKLESVDEMICEVRGKKPPVTSRAHVDPIRNLRKTLRQHYEKKREHYGLDHPSFYDRDLRRLFSDKPKHVKLIAAATFLNRIRSEVRSSVAKWTGEYQYTIDQVISEMIVRCREMKLRVDCDPADAKRDVTILVAIQTMNFLHEGRHRVAL